VAILLLALYNVKGALVLSGVDMGFLSKNQDTTIVSSENSELSIEIKPNGYSPKNFSVKAGSQVKIHLKNNDAYTCAQAFTIPKLGIQKVIAPGESGIIEFTAPNTPGKLIFACSMGMYTGVINVL
jgi:plastocyanin domain-containing protein